MRRLFFLDRSKSLIVIISALWSVFVFATYFFTDFDDYFGKPWTKIILLSGYFSLAIHLAYQTILKNLVSYNSSGMTIKLDSYMKSGDTFKFSDIDNSNYITHDKELIITLKNKNTLHFDLSKIHPDDIDKLLNLLMSKSKIIKSYPQTGRF